LRVYTVCSVPLTGRSASRRPRPTLPRRQRQRQRQRQRRSAPAVVDNWLRTPFIAVRDARRVYVDIAFSMRRCAVYDDYHQSLVMTPHSHCTSLYALSCRTQSRLCVLLLLMTLTHAVLSVETESIGRRADCEHTATRRSIIHQSVSTAHQPV